MDIFLKKTSIWRQRLYKILIKIKKVLNMAIYTINPSDRGSWDSQYIRGEWDHMADLNQLGRYSIIIGYLRMFKRGGSILEVGCGDGLLQEKLVRSDFSKYVGFDISTEAIKRASKKAGENVQFISNDMQTYDTDEIFDAIIFNESVYYVGDSKIIDLLKKYKRYLKDDGILIISMLQHRRSNNIWRIVDLVFSPIDGTTIRNKDNKIWIIKVFKNSS